MLNIKSIKQNAKNPPLFVRGRVVEWKPLRELNIGIIEF